MDALAYTTQHQREIILIRGSVLTFIITTTPSAAKMATTARVLHLYAITRRYPCSLRRLHAPALRPRSSAIAGRGCLKTIQKESPQRLPARAWESESLNRARTSPTRHLPL